MEYTEVEVELEPRSETLEQHGVSNQDLEAALDQVVQGYNDMIENLDESVVIVPSIEDARVEIKGRSFRLGDLAKIV